MTAVQRTVTVLFTDVVGSTSMLSRLGQERWEEMRREHFAGLRSAIAIHRGREVKTLGDGFMVVFESANDGLACAVTMQRGVLRDGRRHPDRQLGLRVGVSAGEVMCEGGDYFGVPVVEASRLCGESAQGQIVATGLVHALTGPNGLHRLAPVGELAPKGLAPMPVWEVEWDSDGDAGLRVALAEDSVLLREGIASVLEAHGIDVVLQASDARELFAGMAAMRPHVVVMDVRMPPTHTTEGLDAAHRIRIEFPEIAVLVLSQDVDPDDARQLLDGQTAGVGYLLKERLGDSGELVTAIRTVASGGSSIDGEVIAALATNSRSCWYPSRHRARPG